MNYALRSNDIRQSNEKLVLNLIFQNRTISQSQIVQQTGLKAPTVYRIFAKLEEAGFIQPCAADVLPEDAPDSERKGRRPSYYCVEPTSGYAIGVDFSSVAAAAILVDFRNHVIFQTSRELTEDPSAAPDRDHILVVIEHMIDQALAETGVVADALIGIGIASPGVVDTENGRVLEYARIEGLSGFSLRGHFEEIFNVPVYVHNNASVIASSAYHYGLAREEDSLLAVLVRFGMGGALVNHGEIFLNGTNTALELGRTTMEVPSQSDPVPVGAHTSRAPADTSRAPADTGTAGVGSPPREPNPAGEHPALETMIAEQPLLQRLREHCDVASWVDADERLTTADVSAALPRERLVFGASLRNLYHVFHPEAILLISRYRVLSEFLGEAARAAVPECRVVAMVYDPVQACYGATDIVFQRFFRVTPGSV